MNSWDKMINHYKILLSLRRIKKLPSPVISFRVLKKRFPRQMEKILTIMSGNLLQVKMHQHSSEVGLLTLQELN